MNDIPRLTWISRRWMGFRGWLGQKLSLVSVLTIIGLGFGLYRQWCEIQQFKASAKRNDTAASKLKLELENTRLENQKRQLELAPKGSVSFGKSGAEWACIVTNEGLHDITDPRLSVSVVQIRDGKVDWLGSSTSHNSKIAPGKSWGIPVFSKLNQSTPPIVFEIGEFTGRYPGREELIEWEALIMLDVDEKTGKKLGWRPLNSPLDEVTTEKELLKQVIKVTKTRVKPDQASGASGK